MTSRRFFLQSASALSAALLVKGPAYAFKSTPLIGLQLYTVRDLMAKDPVGTIKAISKIGYTSVEDATYTGSEQFYGMEANDFRKLLKDNGLEVPSGHYRLGLEKTPTEVKGTMTNDWGKAVDDAASLGLKYMVCAYLSADERGDIDHYKKLADMFNVAGETCQKSGIQFCYHNHDFEFAKQGDVYPYDILLESTDKALVKMEMDLYWVTKAGMDPIALFKKHPNRFPLWHVKDMDKTADKNFTEVGNGVIDFKKIFTYQKLAGMKYFFVEEDKCPGSPLDSITQSITYIKQNLV